MQTFVTYPTDEGVIPETSQTNKTEHFFMNNFHIEGPWRLPNVLGVVVVGQIKVLGHGKISSMVAGIVIISLHRPKMLTKTFRKFTAGFSDVQHVTSLAKDRIDHAGGSTIEPPFEVSTSARGSYRISLRRVVTSATPRSVAWKCSWWCLVLLRVGGKGTMDQDVTEITFSPIDAQGLVVKYVRSGWVFSQNAEIGQEDFLNNNPF